MLMFAGLFLHACVARSSAWVIHSMDIKMGMTSQEASQLIDRRYSYREVSSGAHRGTSKFDRLMGTTGTVSDRTSYWDDDDYRLILKFRKDKLVDWILRPNINPLKDSYKLLKIGQRENQVIQEVGEPDSVDAHVDGRDVMKRWEYWEGWEPRRQLEVDFINGKVVSRRFGPNLLSVAPAPWQKGWKPVNDPPSGR